MTAITVTPRPVRRDERDYSLSTPLMGGGMVPGFPDLAFPVSGKAVRGQLRFWWRALRGGQFGGSLAAMRDAERALFGGASDTDAKGTVSAVQITVVPDQNSATQEEEVPGLNTAIGYLAFALRDAQHPVSRASPKLLQGVRFRLGVSVEPLNLPPGHSESWAWQELEAALWGLETCGGIGARTRRGFGALQRRPAPEGALEDLVMAGLRRHLTPGVWPGGVPHLTMDAADWAFGTQAGNTARAVWEGQARKLKVFRRATHNGEDRGATLWPESDSLLALQDGEPGPYPFPRAALGLPIVFGKGGNDVNGKDVQRLASPVLFRPVQLGERYSSLAFRLRSEPAPGDPLAPEGRLVVRAGKRAHEGQRHQLTPAEARAVSVLETAGTVTTDVAAALLNAFRRS
ncbi:RAMP superfamily CRISPR-associated protein [Deinococcus marmoris]|uniref:RAMP superfamily CRISPR-associated protein n=1 Tax=Deinococcus marmoris TaxID=249408 RepID=UPI00068D155E|nr:RAMP superfamily CRISPR-associated protein [Deinococcus marmoris]